MNVQRLRKECADLLESATCTARKLLEGTESAGDPPWNIRPLGEALAEFQDLARVAGRLEQAALDILYVQSLPMPSHFQVCDSCKGTGCASRDPEHSRQCSKCLGTGGTQWDFASPSTVVCDGCGKTTPCTHRPNEGWRCAPCVRALHRVSACCDAWDVDE